MRKPTNRFARFAALLLLPALLAVLPASPASAVPANANVYAVTPQWGGWCLGWGNRITRVTWVNHTTGGSGGDSGDDIVWMPVRTRYSNSVTMAVNCSRSTPIGMNYTIQPSRNGQTFWFRLNGTYSNN